MNLIKLLTIPITCTFIVCFSNNTMPPAKQSHHARRISAPLYFIHPQHPIGPKAASLITMVAGTAFVMALDHTLSSPNSPSPENAPHAFIPRR